MVNCPLKRSEPRFFFFPLRVLPKKPGPSPTRNVCCSIAKGPLIRPGMPEANCGLCITLACASRPKLKMTVARATMG